MTLSPDPRLRATARFVAVAIVLTCVASAWQDEIVGGLLPLFRVWLEFIDDNYRTIDLSVIHVHGESMVRRLATPGFLQVVGGTMVYPDGSRQFSNQATTGMVLQPSILAIALLVGWPWKHVRVLAVRIAVAVVPIVLAMLLDVPTMLYGFAWLDELNALNADRFSFLVSWADAMNAGGRFVLALVAVFFSIRLGAAVTSRPTAPEGHDATTFAGTNPLPEHTGAGLENEHAVIANPGPPKSSA